MDPCMKDFYYGIGKIMLICFLIVCLLVCAVILLVKVIRKTKKRSAVIALAVCTVLLGTAVLHAMSHKYSYKYNDWLILSLDIQTVEKIYGEFDKRDTGFANTVAYYMYKDEGHIMSSHSDMYYYIEYGPKGKVQRVFMGGTPGG